MAQVKMKYGIDLGTTNSAICKMENGEPTIKKADDLKDTMASCVSFTKKQVIKVGTSAYNDLRQDKSRATKKWAAGNENVFLEFKRTMGLDTKYSSSNMGREYNSEELSAEVLKALKSFVSEDNVNAAVITIPAKFKADQIAATKRAATLAGIEHCELLQEPIAAAMAYGLSVENKNGYWLVFDFGGGTFDAALLRVEEGVMQVFDTEGDNYLGGKNLDYAIVDEIIIPYLQENYTIDNILADNTKKQILRDAMKFYAEQAKNQLSFKDKCDITSQLDEFGVDDDDNDIELDMIITQDQLKAVIQPIFQKAVDICKDLLQRNNLNGSQLDSLILVGGPTHSPVVRQMLKEQITTNVDTSIDPMTAVAKGAALFASTIDSEAKEEVKIGTIQLDIKYKSTAVKNDSPVSLMLAPNQKDVPAKLYVELVRGDKAWSSGKMEIGNGVVVKCSLNEGKANAFSVNIYDEKGTAYPCFPNEINVIQGVNVGAAVLPYNIGIEVTDTERDKQVFVSLKGLEKNQQIPAVGVRNGLKTLRQLRPGMSEDKLVIPIYQGEFNVDGTSAIHNDHVFDVEITGDDVPQLVPANSDIDITLKVDRSQMMKLEATFPVIGETIEKKFDVKARSGVDGGDLSKRLIEAKLKMSALRSADSVSQSEIEEAEKMLNDVEGRFDGEKNSEDGKMHLLADLRRTFLKMEEVEKNHEWDTIEAELRHEFDRLEKANNDLGNKHDQEVNELRKQTDAVIRSRDVKMGRRVLKMIEQVFVQVTFIYQLMGCIEHYDRNFGRCAWRNANQARQLLNQGKDMIASGNINEQRLLGICQDVLNLLPEDERQGGGGIGM